MLVLMLALANIPRPDNDISIQRYDGAHGGVHTFDAYTSAVTLRMFVVQQHNRQLDEGLPTEQRVVEIREL